MVICDINGNHEVHSVVELESVLAKRHAGGSNSFWLAVSPGSYPQLAVLVSNNYATLNYLPREQDAGLRSVGGGTDLEPSGSTSFLISSLGDRIPALNDAIVPVSVALDAAKEFFADQHLPMSVNWVEL
jgi:hypothetical protein